MSRFISTALLAAALAGMAMPAQALDLTIEVSGARGSEGAVLGALYDSAESWLKKPLRAERATAGARAVLVFRDLPAGTYALALFHDQNGNGKMDTNPVGMPIEAYGFSRNARGDFGPPKFDAAALSLGADMTIEVVLQ